MPAPRLCSAEQVENLRLQDVAAADIEIGGRVLRRRLLHHAGQAEGVAARTDRLADADDAVFGGLGGVALADRDHIAAGLVVDRDHLRQAAGFALHDHVGKHHREGLVADQMAGAPHRMAEAERRLLADGADLGRPWA